MVDVLTRAGGRGPRSPLAETPQRRVTGADIMQPYSATGEALGYFGDRLEAAAEPIHQAAGAKAVELDAEGNPRVNWRFGFTAGDQAFSAAARQAGLAKWKNGFADEMQQLRVQHANDPESFRAAATEFVKRAGSNDPLLAPLMEQEAESVVSQHYRGLLTDQQNIDRQRFNNELKAREGHITGQLERLYEEGGGNTPEAQALLGELFDLRSSLANNPEFAYSDVQRGIDDENTAQHLSATAIVGEFRRRYADTGDLAGTIQEAERRLADLNLPPEQRQRYLAQVTQRNSAASELRRIQRQEAVEASDAMIAALDLDPSIDPGRVAQQVDELRRLGAHSQAVKLEAAGIVRDLSPVFSSGTAAEKSEALAGLRKRVTEGASAPVTDASQLLRDFEGFRARPYWDVNAYRIGYGSDTITRADGTIVRVRPGMEVTREDAERDLARRSAEFQQGIIRDIGVDSWSGYGENVQAALKSIAYNYGSLPGSVVRAASSGDPELIAQAVEGLKGHNDGINAGRRQREADLIRGGGATGSAAYVAAKSELQRRFNDSAVGLWNGVKAAFDDGYSPTADELNELAAMFPLISDAKTRDEIVERLNREGALDALDGIEQFHLREMIDDSRRAAEAGDLNPAERALLNAMDDREQALTQRLRDDPLSLASGAGPLASELGTGVRGSIGPLRFEDSDALGRQLGARGLVARTVSAYHRQPLGSVLRPSDVPQIRQMLQSGDAETVAAFFSSIEGLDDDLLAATLSDKKLAESVSGLLKTTDPERYGAAMSGMDQIMRRNPDLFVDAFGEDAVGRVRGWQDALVYATPEQQARALQRRLDGSQGAIVQEWEREAETFARTKRAADIGAELLGTFERSWRADLTAPEARVALENDYRQVLKKQMVITGDIDAAHGAAIETLRRRWATSPANNGMLTKHPPEKHYPQIGGSHDWIREQLVEDLSSHLEMDGADMEPEARGRAPRAFIRSRGTSGDQRRFDVPYTLVATADTQADINAGDPPRYDVVFTDPETGLLEVLPWRADFDKAMMPARMRAAEQRRQFLEAERAGREQAEERLGDPDFNRGRRGIDALDQRRREMD